MVAWPVLRLLWLLETSSSVSCFDFSQYNWWKNIPWTLNLLLLYQIHAQKALFKVPKICNIIFWIENDPPPWHPSKNSSDLVAGSFPKYAQILSHFNCFTFEKPAYFNSFYWTQWSGGNLPPALQNLPESLVSLFTHNRAVSGALIYLHVLLGHYH